MGCLDSDRCRVHAVISEVAIFPAEVYATTSFILPIKFFRVKSSEFELADPDPAYPQILD